MVNSSESFANETCYIRSQEYFDGFVKAAKKAISTDLDMYMDTDYYTGFVGEPGCAHFLNDPSENDGYRELFAKHLEPFLLRYNKNYYLVFDANQEDDSYSSVKEWEAVQVSRQKIVEFLKNGGVYDENWNVKSYDEMC
jgi:hypothetical protein